MIYLILGDNFKEIKKQKESLIKKGVLLMNVDTISFDNEKFQKSIYSQNIFGERDIVVLDNLFKDKNIEKIILENTKELESSETIFIIIEEKLSKKTLEKIEKCTMEVFQHSSSSQKKHEFQIFSIANSVGKRDKKQSWILLQSAYDEEIAPENIYGTLFWKFKSILLSGNTSVYSKDEAKHFLGLLIDIYHNARLGKEDFKIGLERFVLGL